MTTPAQHKKHFNGFAKLLALAGILAASGLLAGLSACGGGGGGGGAAAPTSTTAITYTIGGSVTGVVGAGLVLQNNNADDNAVAADGTFTFATAIADGAAYSVTAKTQPPGQTCTVSTGSGTVSGNNVSNVAVVCATNAYNVGGTISGLTGTVVLQDNNGDNLSISANGSFTFASKIAYGSPYSVTVLTQPTGKTCSVASGTGTMAAADVSNVAITCAANTYTIGGTVSGLNGSMVLQDNGGDNLTVATNGAFHFATAVTHGNAYNVTLLSQQYPNYTCSLTGGSGTATANVTSVAVNCMKHTVPRYAFVTDSADNSIATYVVDNASGRLRYIGKKTGGTGQFSAAVHPSGKYIYVANFGSNDISQFSLGADGKLTAIGTGTVASGDINNHPNSIVVDPTGKYVYAECNGADSAFWQYQVGVDGALTSMTPVSMLAGNSTGRIAVDPFGKYFYGGDKGGNSVFQYTIGTGGALAAMSPATVLAGTNTHAVTVDPSGKYLYAANNASNDVSQFTIGTNGALTSIGATVGAGGTAWSVAVDPASMYAYVANGSAVAQFNIGGNGALSAMIISSVAAGVNTSFVSVDPSGKYVYATNDNGGISQYSIGAGGALTALAPAMSATLNTPRSVNISAGIVPVQAVPKYAYVANNNTNDVSAYNINAGTGALTQILCGGGAGCTGDNFTVGTGPQSVTVDPTGKFAYVVNTGSGDVSAFIINAGTGALTQIDCGSIAGACNVKNFLAGTSPQSVNVDPLGRFAYVANNGSSDVSAYTINASTGALTQIDCGSVAGVCNVKNYLGGNKPSSVTIDPSGKFAYVANWLSGDVSAYAINASTGALTQIDCGSGAGCNVKNYLAGTISSSVTIDPSGKYAYVANYSSNDVSAYTINATTGALTQIDCGSGAGCNVKNFTAGAAPYSVTVDPTGKYAYVANSTNGAGGNSVSQYTIGATGALTAMSTATVATGTSPVYVTVDTSGKYAYVTNAGDNSVSQYTIGVNGALTPMTTATVTTGMNNPHSVATTGTWQ